MMLIILRGVAAHMIGVLVTRIKRTLCVCTSAIMDLFMALLGLQPHQLFVYALVEYHHRAFYGVLEGFSPCQLPASG